MNKVEKLEQCLRDWLEFAAMLSGEYRFLSKNLVEKTIKELKDVSADQDL